MSTQKQSDKATPPPGSEPDIKAAAKVGDSSGPTDANAGGSNAAADGTKAGAGAKSGAFGKKTSNGANKSPRPVKKFKTEQPQSSNQASAGRKSGVSSNAKNAKAKGQAGQSNQEMLEQEAVALPTTGEALAQAVSSPPKLIKKYVSTVSYLRPATEGKSIDGLKQRGHSASTIHSKSGAVAKKRQAMIRALQMNEKSNQKEPSPRDGGRNVKSLMSRSGTQYNNQSALSQEQINIVTNQGSNANMLAMH